MQTAEPHPANTPVFLPPAIGGGMGGVAVGGAGGDGGSEVRRRTGCGARLDDNEPRNAVWRDSRSARMDGVVGAPRERHVGAVLARTLSNA